MKREGKEAGRREVSGRVKVKGDLRVRGEVHLGFHLHLSSLSSPFTSARVKDGVS